MKQTYQMVDYSQHKKKSERKNRKQKTRREKEKEENHPKIQN